MNIYRHGDVLLKEIDSIPKSAKKIKDKNLAYGEATGHSHRFADPRLIERFSDANKNYLLVCEDADLIHEEHKKIRVKKGKYEQIQEREYDYAEQNMRSVVD